MRTITKNTSSDICTEKSSGSPIYRTPTRVDNYNNKRKTRNGLIWGRLSIIYPPSFGDT